MSSQDTSDSSNSPKTESSPIFLKNPFYHRETTSESVDTNSSSLSDYFNDSGTFQSQEETPDTKDLEIQIENDEKINEIVLKNFPGKITIEYSSINPNKSGGIRRISEEIGVQTDEVHGNVKEEVELQSEVSIKTERNEENEGIKQENNGRNEEVFIPKIEVNDEFDEVGNELKHEVWNEVQNRVLNEVRNEFKDEVRNEVLSEVRNEFKDEVRDEVLNEVRNELRNDVQNEFKNEIQNELRNEVRNEIRNELRNEVRNELQNRVVNEVRNEFRNKVRNELRNEVQNQLKDEVRNEVQNSILNGVRNELGNEAQNTLKVEVLDEVRNELRNEVQNEFRNEIQNEVRNALSNELRNEVGNVLQIEVTLLEMDVDPSNDIKSENSQNDSISHSSIHEFPEDLKEPIKTDPDSSNSSEIDASSCGINSECSRIDDDNDSTHGINLQNIKNDDSNHAEKPNIKIEDLRDKNHSQIPEIPDIPRNINPLRQENAELSLKFRGMEFEEAQEDSDDRDPFEAPGIADNYSGIDVSEVDEPETQMEVEESDENHKDLIDEELPIPQPRIYVKSRTQLFPEGYRSLNSTQEERTQVPKDFVDNARNVEAEEGISDDSDEGEWIKTKSGTGGIERNKGFGIPKEPQDLRRKGRKENSGKSVERDIPDSLDVGEGIKVEESGSECSSEESVIPVKMDRSSQVHLGMPGERGNGRRDSGGMDECGETDRKEGIVFTRGSQPYRGKPFSPQEDIAIVEYVVSTLRERQWLFSRMTEGDWKDMAALSEWKHRTWKSLQNRFTRYLKGRMRNYIKDPQLREWFNRETRG